MTARKFFDESTCHLVHFHSENCCPIKFGNSTVSGRRTSGKYFKASRRAARKGKFLGEVWNGMQRVALENGKVAARLERKWKI